MPEIVAAVEAAAPEAAGKITHEESPLPFPGELEAHVLELATGPVQQPSIADGIAETIELYRRSARAARTSFAP